MIYGYSKKRISKEGLLELKEVSFQLDPSGLRRLAKFLETTAIEMEDLGERSSNWHRHLSSSDPKLRDDQGGADVVVLCPEDYRPDTVTNYVVDA